MILDVSRPALRVGDQGVERSLTLELAQDRRVRASDGVRQHVEATSMGDSDHDFVGAAGGGQLDCLVQHGHERVEPLDRELLLPDERAPQERLEGLDLCQPPEEGEPILRRERLAEATRLDRAAQPDALGVVRDVLDLVRDRPHVDLLQPRQRIEQGLSFDREPEEPGGNLRLKLGGQRRAEALGLERRIAGRLRAERIEMRREVTVHANRFHESHRGRDCRQQLPVSGCFRRRRRRRRGRLDATAAGCGSRSGRRARPAVREPPFRPAPTRLDQPGEPGQSGEDAVVRAFEQLTPGGIDRLRVLEILLEERPDVAGVRGRRLSRATSARHAN